MPAAPPRLLERLQLLTGFESNGLSRRNGNFRTGARIAADAGLARLDVEDAKSPQFNAIALLESLLHGLKDGLDGHFGLGLGDAGTVHNFVDDIELDQGSLLTR